MEWRAPDKVSAWRQFRRWMEVIFVADQVAADRQWALILVAGGNEAYNRWDTLEETVENKEDVEQVWQAFEKSFEQSSSFWHFRDAYLADETTADGAPSRLSKDASGRKVTEEQRLAVPCRYVSTFKRPIRTHSCMRQL